MRRLDDTSLVKGDFFGRAYGEQCEDNAQRRIVGT
jgi:hypothetical protein